MSFVIEKIPVKMGIDSSSDGSGLMTAAISARRLFASIAAVTRAEGADSVTPTTRQKAERKDGQAHFCKEGPCIFRKMYRMTVFVFNNLLSGVKKKTETYNDDMAVMFSESPVCVEVRLAMTLRFWLEVKCGISGAI